MPAVVHARRHLIRQQRFSSLLIPRHKELNREHAHIVQMFHDRECRGSRLLLDSRRTPPTIPTTLRRRRNAEPQNAVLVPILNQGPRVERTIDPAHPR